MSKLQKWLIIIGCIVVAFLLMTFGCKLVTGYVLGPVPILVAVFIIYGIGRVWTRSPSTETEPSAGENEEK